MNNTITISQAMSSTVNASPTLVDGGVVSFNSEGKALIYASPYSYMLNPLTVRITFCTKCHLISIESNGQRQSSFLSSNIKLSFLDLKNKLHSFQSEGEYDLQEDDNSCYLAYVKEHDHPDLKNLVRISSAVGPVITKTKKNKPMCIG